MRFCVQLLYFVTLIDSAYYFSLLRCCIIYKTKTTLCDHLRGLHILPTLINNFIALLTALLHCFRKECVWGTRLFCSHSLSTQPIKEMNNIFCYLKYCILIPLEAILLPYNFMGDFFFYKKAFGEHTYALHNLDYFSLLQQFERWQTRYMHNNVNPAFPL